MRLLKRSIILILVGIVIVGITISITALTLNNNEKNSQVNYFPNIKEKTITVQIGGKLLSNDALSVAVSEKIIFDKPSYAVIIMPISRGWNNWEVPDTNFLILTDENQKPIPTKPFLIDDLLVEKKIPSLPDDKIGFDSPYIIPITNNSTYNIVIIKYSMPKIKPDDDGTYHLKFASFSYTKIELPDGAITTSNNTKTFSIDYEDPNTKVKLNNGIIYDIIFRLG